MLGVMLGETYVVGGRSDCSRGKCCNGNVITLQSRIGFPVFSSVTDLWVGMGYMNLET